MRSARPKPLHHLCGRAMVLYVLDAAQQEDVRATVVVVGREATWVEKEISERRAPNARLTFVEQREQLGTGHAVGVALSSLDDAFGDLDGDVLILPGDAPLLRRSSVEQLLAAHRERHAALTMLGARFEDPRQGRQPPAGRRRERRHERRATHHRGEHVSDGGASKSARPGAASSRPP